MALALIANTTKRREQIVAFDLGSRTTKAVHLLRRGDKFVLKAFALLDAPIFDKTLSPELLAEHLKAVAGSLNNPTRQVVLILGIGDSILRHAELPMIPASDMRLMLKFNSKNYLQQDLPDYVYDCQILPPKELPQGETLKPGQKSRVLVGGAKKQFLDDLQAATKSAGLNAIHVTPGQIGTANAFEMAEPDLFAKGVVALVDLGFKNSTISIIDQGELALNRVVALGGDKLTSSLAETLNVSYAEAEGIKIGLPEEVRSAMQALLMPLGRELRASLDFFEHQQDKTVSQVFVSGGSARSPFIIESLQSELMIQCKSWNPVSSLALELSPQQIGEIEQIAPQLAVAVGGAMAAF
jgi:type IV pilus assembly protein PilM